MAYLIADQLVDSWTLHLRAERKSPQTIKSYLAGLSGYTDWCSASGLEPELTRAGINGYVAGLLDAGREPATARARQLSLRRFSAWLVEEGEIDVDPLLGLKPPKLDSKVIQPLTEDQLKALLKACAGRDLRDRRDEAIVRFMLETGARAGEVAVLQVDDVNLVNQVAIVRRGKGGKGRSVPFGPQTAVAIDRYKRERSKHKYSARPDLWLGSRQNGFTYDALHKSLEGRARKAGIVGFHPHLLRHTAAHRWLAAGGSEGGLMAVAGWTRPDMLQRYTKAQASERAAAEARGLNLGDI